MYELTTRVWLGVNADAWDKPRLRLLNISASLNLSIDKLVPHVPEPMHVYIPDGLPVDHSDFRLILAWLDAMYGSNHNILIHCMSGVSVGPSIGIAWLLHHRDSKPEQLLKAWHDEEMRLKGLYKPISTDTELKMSMLKYLVRDYSIPTIRP